jgi:putative hydrolase
LIRVENSDLHTHTSYSDGRGNLEENVRAAEAAQLDAIAIADHLFPPDHPRFGDRERLRARLEEVAQVRAWAGLRVIMAVEATATDVEGTLSVSEADLEGLELCLVDVSWITAGLAVSAPADPDRQLAGAFQLYNRLAAHDWVDVVAHPFTLGRFGLDITLEDLPEAALREWGANLAEHGTAFEINNGVWWWWPQYHPIQLAEAYARVVAIVAESGARFTLGSDAHCNTGVGNLGWAKRVAQLAGLGEDNWARVEDLIGRRR